ncbi:tyrosine-type recombinase/integrase [Gordonia tangerina]|uniref:Site-specific integrase n=1 Tax=Gordonia tangerina TaxID=2911060 RepID=A0ABS9DLC9_9ACTN|nr:site-specific integrase [Gordonia tangerina]MCF3939962.1 site-specific integrase [Gordonia tangerina]
MASIQSRPLKDGTPRWRVLWREGKDQKNQTFWDLAAAEEFKTNLELHGPDEAYRVLDLVDTVGRELTLTQWLKRHTQELTGIQQATRDRYTSYIDHDIAPTIGTLPLSAVTEATIGRWVAGMESTSSGKTLQNKHAFLSGALKAAVRDGRIDRNPCDNRRLPRTLKTEMVFLSKAEFDQIHGAIKRDLWKDLALWLVSTGMRFGEATALQPGDVDLAEGTCRISRSWKYSGGYKRVLGTTKTRRSDRTINLPPQAVEIAQRRQGGEWLFHNLAGNPVGPQDFYNQAWGEARKVLLNEAGEGKKPRVHDLRHTCASWMIAAGVPLVVVSRHLGHEDITTTAQVYTHLDRDGFRQAADAIGKLFT